MKKSRPKPKQVTLILSQEVLQYLRFGLLAVAHRDT